MTVAANPPEIPPKGQAPSPGFQQRLGLFDSTMLVAGSMIGSGIFIVSAEIARDVGSAGWLMVVWLVTGVMTVIGALSYAELAAMMPRAGGQYVYLREAYSPFWGFLYGWTLFLVIQTGTIAAVGVAFAKFLGALAPQLGTLKDAGARVLYEVPDLNWKLTANLPWFPEPLTFFERKEFVITAGQIVAVAVIVFLTLLNTLGVQEGKWIQNIFTVAKTLALALLIVLGLAVAWNAEAFAENTRDLWGGATETAKYQTTSKLLHTGGLLVVLMVAGGAMVGSLFSSDAWNNVTFTAGEVRNPRRNLPLSLAMGTGLVIGLYLLANVAYLATLPVRGNVEKAEQLERLAKVAEREGLEQDAREKQQEAVLTRGIQHAKDERVGTALMERVWPRFGAPFMAIAIMLSTFGCANGLILMGARLYYAMARDGLFFQSVGRLNQHGVPAAGLIFQCVWASLLVFSGTYGDLLDYVIFAALLFYALTVVGLFVLRRKQPQAERPYRAVGYPILPALYVVLCVLLMIDLLVVKPVYTWPGLLIVLTGVPVYFLWRRKAINPS
ncbi:MAG: APC family permease [Gemmataceae bacterium]